MNFIGPRTPPPMTVQIPLNNYINSAYGYINADLRTIQANFTESRAVHYISLLCVEEEKLLFALDFDIGIIDAKY